MDFINTLLGDVAGWFIDRLASAFSAVGWTSVVDAIDTAVSGVASWNNVFPMATLFTIAISTFFIRITIRVVRFFAGFVPTIHG